MKKARLALSLLTAAALLLSGCSGKTLASTSISMDKTGVFVSKDGSLSATVVEKYESKDYYSEEELKTEMEGIISEYNSASGYEAGGKNTDGSSAKAPVSLTACTLKDGVGKLVFTYGDSSALIKFAEEYQLDLQDGLTSLTYETIADAAAKGEIKGLSFVKTKDKSDVAGDTIAKETDLFVVTVEGATRIQTEGKILFYSQGVIPENDFAAVTPEGKSCIIFK